MTEPNPALGSALTCFGVGGTDTRLYYLDGNSNPIELAWVGNWAVNQLP